MRISLFLFLALWLPRDTRTLRDDFSEPPLNEQWTVEDVGPTYTVRDGALRVKGEFLPSNSSTEQARVWMIFNAAAFIAFELDLTVNTNSLDIVRSGVFLSREKMVRKENRFGYQVINQVALARRADGVLERRVVNEQATEERPLPPWELTSHASPFPPGKTMKLRIARIGKTQDQVEVTVNGTSVFTTDALPWLVSLNDFSLGFFVEGKPSAVADVTIDNVRWTLTD